MDNKTKIFLIIAGVIVVLGGVGVWFSMNKETTYVSVDTDRPFRGNPEAKVLVEEFSDFQCPACKTAENTANLVASKYADQIKFVYYNFPLTQIHPLAFRASLAVECAHDQNKFWEYHDLLFINQPKFSRAELISYAEGLGLNMESFTSCLDERAKNDAVRADMDEGIKRDLKGTPTFYVNGKVVPDWSKLEQAVLDALPSQDQATITTE